MDKPQLDEVQWVEEMNRRIPTYDGYTAGKVVLSPAGSQAVNASGYDWDGPAGCEGLMARARAEVERDFTLRPTRRA